MSANTNKKPTTTVVMSGKITFFWAFLFFMIGLVTGLAYNSPPRISFHFEAGDHFFNAMDGGVK